MSVGRYWRGHVEKALPPAVIETAFTCSLVLVATHYVTPVWYIEGTAPSAKPVSLSQLRKQSVQKQSAIWFFAFRP